MVALVSLHEAVLQALAAELRGTAYMPPNFDGCTKSGIVVDRVERAKPG